VVYANIDGFDPGATVDPVPVPERPLPDRWIIASLQKLVASVRDGLDNYEVTNSGRQIQEFIDDLSNWYVRRSRRRFWKSEADTDKASAYLTLHECLVTVAKLLAPYTPFISEEIYRNLVCSVDAVAPESVHLCDFPVPRTELIDEELIFEMRTVRGVINLGRTARNKAAIKTRQPLAEAIVVADDRQQEAVEKLVGLVEDELNVQRVSFVREATELADVRLKPDLKKLGPRFGPLRPQVDAAIAALEGRRTLEILESEGRIGITVEGREEMLSRDEILVEEVEREGYAVESQGTRAVALRTEIDEDLRRQGLARELVHGVQNLRKEAGLRIEDTIAIDIGGSEQLLEIAGQFSDFLKAETLCRELTIAGKEQPGAYTAELTFDTESLRVSIRRLGTIRDEP
jgi:isoleucyl-tRNA synthetase